MDPDKELSRAAERLKASLADEMIPASPRPPQRPWFATALAAAALTIGIVGVAYIATTDGNGTEVTAETSTTQTFLDTTNPPDQRVYAINNPQISVEVPAGWQVSPETLAPANSRGAQYEFMAIGTFEMRPGAENCGYLPENALSDMESTEVLVTFQFNSASNSPLWPPDQFGPDSWLPRGPESAVAKCTGRVDLDDRWAVYRQSNQGIVVRAVFGDEVSNQTVLETYALINSFSIEDTGPPDEPYDPGYIQSWSMQYGPEWYRSEGSELMPNLGGESVTLATFPLRPGGDLCAHMPDHALRDLGPEDSLMTISQGAGVTGQPWPDGGFNDITFPATPGTDAQDCAERPDLEIHWGHGVLVAFGEDVTEERRAETWAVLSSFQPEPDVPGAPGRGWCVSTRPPVPGLVPPDRWSPTPSDPDSVWYGTPDLWVPMPIDGMYQERKSVWWSQNFTDAGQESSPLIAVRYDRIDRDVPSVVVIEPGTNAFTGEDGLFMIANIEFRPPTPGCWEVTGEYKGETLSYVIDVP